MFVRCMRHSLRNLDILLTAVMQPLATLIIFVYMFGGAISGGDANYINYVVPGIIILTVGYCASFTAISVNTDLSKGIIDRFRSMPISRSSVLTGHVLASVARNCIATLVVVIVAIFMGLRFTAGPIEWIIAIGILLLYMLVITWLSVFFGLIASSPDSATTVGFLVLILPYLSSGFVPTDTIPGVLRVFAVNQPLTPIIETLRSLLIYSSVGEHLLPSVLWCAGLLVVTYIGSMVIYDRKVKN